MELSGSTPWVLEEGGPGDRAITLRYRTITGPDLADELEGVELREDEQVVRIAVLQTIRAPEETFSYVTVSRYVNLELAAPLGERRLVHDPVADELARFVPEPRPEGWRDRQV